MQVCEAAADRIPQELIGTWHENSMTALKNGKSFGTGNFKPGQLSITFSADGMWLIDTTVPRPHKLNGSYEVHGYDLDMKWEDGKPYALYHYKIAQNGKQLLLKNDEVSIVASRK